MQPCCCIYELPELTNLKKGLWAFKVSRGSEHKEKSLFNGWIFIGEVKNILAIWKINYSVMTLPPSRDKYGWEILEKILSNKFQEEGNKSARSSTKLHWWMKILILNWIIFAHLGIADFSSANQSVLFTVLKFTYFFNLYFNLLI